MLYWQRIERWLVELLEQTAPADTEAPHWPVIQIGHQPRDRAIKLGQREESLVSEPGKGSTAQPPARRPRPRPWSPRSTAGCVGTTSNRICVHPFHPLSGHEFELVCRRRHWGEDRVVYLGRDGQLHSISADLTDIDAADEFQRVAAGYAAFHPVDLLALCGLLERLIERRIRKENFAAM